MYAYISHEHGLAHRIKNGFNVSYIFIEMQEDERNGRGAGT